MILRRSQSHASKQPAIDAVIDQVITIGVSSATPCLKEACKIARTKITFGS